MVMLRFLAHGNRFLEFALSHNALIISPDHRLLPEASGTDVLDDVEAFSTWMHDQLPSIAIREAWPASPDLGRVAAIGASSGGYLAMQMALLFSHKIDLKAVMSVCAPLNDISSGTLVPRGPRRILGSWPPPPRQAEALIRDYIRGIKPGTVRSEGDPADMWPMLLSIAREWNFLLPFSSVRCLSIRANIYYSFDNPLTRGGPITHLLIEQAWLPRLLGLRKNPRLDLTKTLDKVESIPPLWISHSEQDSIVSPIGTPDGRISPILTSLCAVSDSCRMLDRVCESGGREISRKSSPSYTEAGRSYVDRCLKHE